MRTGTFLTLMFAWCLMGIGYLLEFPSEVQLIIFIIGFTFLAAIYAFDID